MTDFEPSVSVIMPALNEENSIEGAITDTLSALDRFGLKGEIIVINDGSTDKTGQLSEAMSETDSRVSVIHHKIPMGIGCSFWDGVKQARLESVIYYPGDNEMIPGEMFRYIEELRNVDIVVPWIVNDEVRSSLRQFISKSYAAFIRTLFGIRLRHTNGLVLYRRLILEDIELKSQGFLFQTELLVKTIRRGYLYVEVPYFIRPRLRGKSKALKLKNVLSVIYQIASIASDVFLKGRAEEPDKRSATAKRKLLDAASAAVSSIEQKEDTGNEAN